MPHVVPPAFCSPPTVHWPLPSPLAKVHFASCDFDPTLLRPNDFEQCDIAMPATMQRAVPKRRAEFLAGRLCARQAMTSFCTAPTAPTVNADRSPQWPAGVAGSITHTAGWAAAIASDTRDWRSLGLDAEQLIAPDQAQALLGDILTADERKRLRPEKIHEQVTLIFSLKESLFKALYPLVGRHFYFEDAELTEWHSDGTARLRLLCDLSSEWRYGTELDGQFCYHRGFLLSLIAIPTT